MTLKTVSRIALSILMVVAGTLHFVRPEFYLAIMPLYLPWHRELVAISGAIEIALGVLLQVRRTRRWAAWSLIALFIAIFPANVYLYQHPEIVPLPPLVHLLRLPLQGVLIFWAYCHTRRSP